MKKDHSKRKTNILSFSVVKVQLQCNLRKNRERKKGTFWFYSPKWCIPLYLPRYLLIALNIAGRNCKWNDIWTLLHLDRDINSCLTCLDLICESTFMTANQQFMNSKSFVYYEKHSASFSFFKRVWAHRWFLRTFKLLCILRESKGNILTGFIEMET